MWSLLIALIATALTITMFITRERMLGFPSAIFWMVFAGYEYTLVITPWVDITYYLFFAGAAMTIFCVLAQFGLREVDNKKTDEDEYIDEGADPDDQTYIDEQETIDDADEDGNLNDHTRSRKRRHQHGRIEVPRI